LAAGGPSLERLSRADAASPEKRPPNSRFGRISQWQNTDVAGGIKITLSFAL
jgi:hypothetical protein